MTAAPARPSASAAGAARWPACWLPLASALLALLYGAVGYLSPGFDDEFFNIALVEQHGAGAWRVTQGIDVHPPGSYLLASWLHAALGDWSAVRLTIALGTAAALAGLLWRLRARAGDRAALLALLLIGLNPALLMWGTSLRWYSFFMMLMLCLCLAPRAQGLRYWGPLCAGLLLAAFFGYAALVLAPVLLLLYWQTSDEPAAPRLRGLLWAGLPCALLYAPQLWVFWQVHLPHMATQTSSLASAAAGFAVASVANQGVFPLSLAGLASAAGSALMGLAIARHLWTDGQGRTGLARWRRVPPHLVAALLGVALLLLTRLGGKFRNYLLLAPLQSLALILAAPSRSRPFAVGLGLVVLANFWGVVNVVRHQDTSKNSWNLPVMQVVQAVQEQARGCPPGTRVFVHDPAIGHHLRHAGFRISGPYSGPYSGPADAPIASLQACLFVIETYAGTIDRGKHAQMTQDLRQLQARAASVQRQTFGRDRFHAWKQRLDDRYRETLVELSFLRDVRGADQMPGWAPYHPQP